MFGKKYKKIFWIPAISLLIIAVVSELSATRMTTTEEKSTLIFGEIVDIGKI